MKMLALTIFVHNHWGMENWQVKSRPRVEVRGVAGSKTMCNQRTSARGLGDAEDHHRVKVGGPGGRSPPEGQRF